MLTVDAQWMVNNGSRWPVIVDSSLDVTRAPWRYRLPPRPTGTIKKLIWEWSRGAPARGMTTNSFCEVCPRWYRKISKVSVFLLGSDPFWGLTSNQRTTEGVDWTHPESTHSYPVVIARAFRQGARSQSETRSCTDLEYGPVVLYMAFFCRAFTGCISSPQRGRASSFGDKEKRSPKKCWAELANMWVGDQHNYLQCALPLRWRSQHHPQAAQNF